MQSALTACDPAGQLLLQRAAEPLQALCCSSQLHTSSAACAELQTRPLSDELLAKMPDPPRGSFQDGTSVLTMGPKAFDSRLTLQYASRACSFPGQRRYVTLNSAGTRSTTKPLQTSCLAWSACA